MADMNDLAQQIAFYQAGGGRKPPMDEFNSAFKSVGGIGEQYLGIINDVLKNKQLELQNQKLTQGNRQVADVVGTPLVKETLAASQEDVTQPTRFGLGVDPTGKTVGFKDWEEFQNSIMSQRQGGIDKATDIAKASQRQFGDMTMDQYGTYAQAQKDLRPTVASTPEDLKPLSQMMTFASAKTVLPKLTEQEYMTESIGGFKQRVAGGKQNDLNTERGYRREERMDRFVIEFKDKILNNPELRQIKQQRLGLDTSDDISQLVSGGNSVAASALGIKQAKGLGEVGVMTDSDVVKYIRSGKLSQKSGDILLTWLRGTPTAATLQEVNEINEVIKDRLAQREQEIVGEYVTVLSNNFDITPEEAMRRLGLKAPPAATSGAPADDRIMQQIQSQLPPGTKIKSIKRIR